ncbi:Nuclear factor of activated T-cells, cytoplasmic 4 [Varanus komodoensis]|uniref:nuclear factor of activated T-cells, cytoplasmic 4 isoform X2 n=1 Tax=Varanus komodoensis TaxID=61221 RepID=UPI001CF7C764|nr:nuclear factor of activated T-cells, cytoplasmic 4 isoform X2 [Varanus komodoensis]KAF7235200.1 Nuclear factor of activated T-cells, cytoplasmic 4 [Varanus komodoensis]
MGAANCEDEDLEFKLIFGEEEKDPSAMGVPLEDLGADNLPVYCSPTLGDPPPYASPLGIPCPLHLSGGRAGMHSPPPRPADLDGDTFESQPARRVRLGGSRVLECPSIQITTISPGQRGEEDDWDSSPRDYLLLEAFGGYREAPPSSGFFTPSPASSGSVSPWSFFSDDEAPTGDDVEHELNEAAARFALSSPLGSPRGSPKPWSLADEAWPAYGAGYSPSRGTEDGWMLLGPRPASPCGKRRYSSSETHSSASPCLSRRGSLGEEAPGESAEASGDGALFNCTGARLVESIPQKARKTSTEQTVALSRKEDGSCNGEDGGSSTAGAFGLGAARKEGMDYLAVPSPLAWSKARIGGHSPVFRSSALPPLDWPLPSQYEQFELKIEVQPRTHHRAHYETEGSRGAVKAAPGGHPMVKLLGYDEKPLTLQMFIGTADERNLRPHAFYQVHRITGKMVATTSYESIISGTKVLEMSLLPENNMAANIDCAGILKLRNSDIELRKGETDIGRKNTRVRLVFRVHIPQGNGKVVSIQTASVPIECSQRSAQELPQVENYSLSACSVHGGEELVIHGANFLPESKVVFIERGPDGKLQWEEEANINRLKSTEASLTLTVPEYSNKRVSRPVQIYFYVSNGRRKRSPAQAFKYLPVIFKEEPLPEAQHRSFPHISQNTHFPSQSVQSSMDFSPSGPAYPYGPEHSPPCSPYGPDWNPCSFPSLPPHYSPAFRFPGNEAYRGVNLSVPLLAPAGLPRLHTLDCRPPLFQPPSQQLGPQPPGRGEAHGGERTPEWTGPELVSEEHSPKELEKSGFSSGFRDNLPIHGITLEEVTEIIGRDLSDFPEPSCEAGQS